MISLGITEKLFILSIDDHRSVINEPNRDALRYGLSGALLADLALAHKIRVESNHLTLLDQSPVGDLWVDGILRMIATESKPRPLSYWVDEIGRKSMVRYVAGLLVKLHMIHVEEKRFMRVIPYQVYAQEDPSVKVAVRQHLRGIVLTGERADEPDVVLLSLLKACRLFNILFTREERGSAERQVDNLVKGEPIGEAVAKIFEDIETATFVAAAVVSG